MKHPLLSEVLNEIRKQVDGQCIRNSCSGDGCRVYLTDVPSERIIADLECVFRRRKMHKQRCDYVLFYADTAQRSLVIVLIELKSGTFKAPKVANQLQGGADYVSDVFGRLNEEVRSALSVFKTTCVPILFYGGGVDRAQRYKLERAKVQFRNQNAGIKKNKCGQRRNLAEVLSNAGNL